MIDPLIEQLDPCRALVERFTAAPVPLSATGSAREWVESLTAHLPAAEACAVVEHLFGVMPLVEALFEPGEAMDEVASGLKLGALGLFTPSPELGWAAAALDGEPAGKGLLLRGEVRIASSAADGSIVPVRLAAGEHRLAWLDHGAPGVDRRGTRAGGAVRGGSPCWLAIDGAAVGPGRVSRPVTLSPEGDLFRHLETYAGIWAFTAALCARAEVRALRRAARTTGHRGTAFGASQHVAIGITEVEIEMELTVAAAQRHFALAGSGGSLALATAAARTLHAVAARSAELRDLAGLELEGPAGEGSAGNLTAYLGGPLMLASELARALGIRDLPAPEAHA